MAENGSLARPDPLLSARADMRTVDVMSIARFALVAFLAFTPVVAGCGGGKQPWSVAAAQGGGVTIEPVDGFVRGQKLWIRTNVVNGGNAPIIVDRDAVKCILPNGMAIPRASGSATVHTPYVIPPGGMHAVYVEFEGDFLGIPSAAIDFSQAITVNGQPIGAPQVAVQNLAPR